MYKYTFTVDKTGGYEGRNYATILEIAQQNKMEKIQVIADKCGLTPDDIEQYGHYKAKISFDAIKRLENKKDGN